MLIDWFTVGAQALNFLILVWLMKRFLYKPILAAIDAREKRIAEALADAEQNKDAAQQEREAFQEKNAEFDQQREAMLVSAMDEAAKERHRLIEEARVASEELFAKHETALRRDAHNLNQEITRRAQNEVFAITRKTLSDLADESLESRMTEVFIHMLKQMDNTSKEKIREAMRATTSPAVLRSAFDLPETQRASIQGVLNQVFSTEIPLHYETTPALVSGIEFVAGGQKISWSIASHLSSLEKKVSALLSDAPEKKKNEQKV